MSRLKYYRVFEGLRVATVLTFISGYALRRRRARRLARGATPHRHPNPAEPHALRAPCHLEFTGRPVGWNWMKEGDAR